MPQGCIYTRYVPTNETAPTFVVLGATGNLARRKLFPALCGLLECGYLPESTRIIAVSRQDFTLQSFLDSVREEMLRAKRAAAEEVFEQFAAMVSTSRLDTGDPASLKDFAAALDRVEATIGRPPNRVFYLAIPPLAQEETVRALISCGLLKAGAGGAYQRVVFEKPFGVDLKTAERLNALLSESLNDNQVFRIDHYAMKDMIENIAALRFGNSIFEYLWSRQYVDHVEILIAEDAGVEGRGAFFEQVGILGDIVQNHLLQILALVAMEPPSGSQPEDIRERRVEVLKALRPFSSRDIASNAVFGQYDGYREEDGVSTDSVTPTFLAARLFIDNARWQGVPFYVRAGKALKKRLTRVVLEYKRPLPREGFRASYGSANLEPNRLIIDVQPAEAVRLGINVKAPGDAFVLEPAIMDFPYRERYEGSIRDAYERVLADVMAGRNSLFWNAEGVTWSWKFIDPLIAAARNVDVKAYPNYSRGSCGPAAALALTQRDGKECFIDK